MSKLTEFFDGPQVFCMSCDWSARADSVSELTTLHERHQRQYHLGRVATPPRLVVGGIIHGYAGGWFGRDHYDCIRIEAVGVDWLVGRTESGRSSATTCLPFRTDEFWHAMKEASVDFSYCREATGSCDFD
jgi:hypothetical protein